MNLEWGNFQSPYLPRTFADEEVDRDSVNPGDQVKVAFADSKLSIQTNLSLE
jgi:hexokinase